MNSVDICGIHREALILILNRTINRLNILQFICPKYLNDNGELINRTEDKLPNILGSDIELENYQSNLFGKQKLPSKSKLASIETLSKSQQFSHDLSKIVDKIEVAKAEFLNKNAVRFDDGRILYISDDQIKERKMKKDLKIITKLFMNIVKEITEYNSFQSVITFNYNQRNVESKIKNNMLNDQKLSTHLTLLKQDILKSKTEIVESKTEFYCLIKHLKHQLQETKNKMAIETKYNEKLNTNNVLIHKTNLENITKKTIDEKNDIIKQINNERTTHDELMIFLRNNNNKLEQSIEYWTDKYSNETNDIKMKIRNFQKNHNAIRNKFYDLSQTYKQYDEIITIARKEKAIEAKQELAEKEFKKNALIIQNWWRHLCFNLKLGPFAVKKPKKSGKDKKKKK